MTHRKKLIEVSIPLDAINAASAREKSIRHGHPSTLHLWWARRPLAAARAVIFAQTVDDPSSRPEVWPTEAEQDAERDRLFEIMERLVTWENTTNEQVLREAREAMRASWRRTCADAQADGLDADLYDPEQMPAFHDPFAGGGALPLEAQRLGLEAHASDLNPVAVLINKAMIEIPPRFAGQPPVNPEARQGGRHAGTSWTGAQGLAEDVRYYGQWMREQAQERIGHLYPGVEITAQMAVDRPDLKKYVGRMLTPIAWLWARTVASPNPAFRGIHVPLVSNFMLSTKKSKQSYVEPLVEGDSYRFRVRTGKPADAKAAKMGTKTGRGANFRCVLSAAPIDSEHIYAEGLAGRMSARLLAVVLEGDRERVYVDPTPEMEAAAERAHPTWKPDVSMPENPRWFSPPLYGLTTFGDLFTARQLVALTTFSDLIGEARALATEHARATGLSDDGVALTDGGSSARAYGEAVCVYLAFAISKLADRGSSIVTWFTARDSTRNTFSRQSIPMTWDFAEPNMLLEGTGSFMGAVSWTAKSIEGVASGLGSPFGSANQVDATSQQVSTRKVVSTDPPYYDNIGYADLSDFFYVWLRHSLGETYPNLFATLAVPKAEELVATPYRHGGTANAKRFFLDGMTQAMQRLADQAHPAFPVTIYYAFKQAERSTAGTSSTGWETFLDAVIRSGLGISGTWPMRTELANRMIGSGTNALASSIVLVCRRRAEDAPVATRREYVTALRAELPVALARLQDAHIAPVDLAQSAIGPGMAVFTRYRQVLDAQGQPLSVRDALVLINEALDEVLAEQEGEFDGDTRWALAWFEQNGFDDGLYGSAETLSKAKNTSVGGLAEAGIVASNRGNVRLLRPAELPAEWDPTTDARLTVWECVHHLVRALDPEIGGGEEAAAHLVARMGATAEVARDLAYRLYAICERTRRSSEAQAYNGLVLAWPEIARLSREPKMQPPAPAPDLFTSA